MHSIKQEKCLFFVPAKMERKFQMSDGFFETGIVENRKSTNELETTKFCSGGSFSYAENETKINIKGQFFRAGFLSIGLGFQDACLIFYIYVIK
jgi:hypothetical protein